MSTPPSILVFGTARDLLETRRLVLAHAGFDVTVALTPQQSGELLAARPFDLLILCHSLTLLQCEAALQEQRTRRPGMKNLILGIVLSAVKGSEHDAHLTAFASPEALINAVTGLTAAPLPAARKKLTSLLKSAPGAFASEH